MDHSSKVVPSICRECAEKRLRAMSLPTWARFLAEWGISWSEEMAGVDGTCADCGDRRRLVVESVLEDGP